MGDQDDAPAQERDARSSRPQAFVEFDVGDAAFVDAGVVGGGDPLGDGELVFAQGSGDTSERWQSALGELIEPRWQGCGITVVGHGGEPADQVVGELEFRTVIEEPMQTVSDVKAAAGRVGGDPACGLARGWRPLAGLVQRQPASQGRDGHFTR